MESWGGILAFWHFEDLEIWDFGDLRFWNFGTFEFGDLEFWDFGNFCTLEIWESLERVRKIFFGILSRIVIIRTVMKAV